MSEARSIVFTGGGTAGHVIPSKPIILALLERGDRVTYVGSKSGLERALISDLEIEFHAIATGKLRRYLSLANLIDFCRIPVGILQAFFLIGKLHADVVFSKGGYVAVPVVAAAWLRRVPVVAHESDLTPGLATRLCLPLVATQCVNFEETVISTKSVVVTGTPVRQELLSGEAERAREWLQLDSDLPVVLVVGGSLGAQKINEVVRDAIHDLTSKATIVHVCGAGNIDESLLEVPNYYPFEYIDREWGDVLAVADVVISRAGANSLYEILSLRIPNILIPLPLTASRGDQIENAELAESRGWSTVLPEEQLSPHLLVETLQKLLDGIEVLRANLGHFGRRNSLELLLSEIDAVLSK